jgi:hypothetical protein
VTATKAQNPKIKPESQGRQSNLNNVSMKSKKHLKRNPDLSLRQLVLRMEKSPVSGASGQRGKEVKLAASLALGTGLHFGDVMLLTWENLSSDGNIDTWDEDIGEVLVGVPDLVLYRLSGGLKMAAPSDRLFPALQREDREHILWLMESAQCIEKYLRKRFRLLRLGIGSPEARLALECMERGIREWRSHRR